MMRIPYNVFICNSKNAIIKSKLIADDSSEAAKYVRELYGNKINKRGLYKQAQKNAKRLLKIAEDNGLSVEKPVIYRREENKTIRCYGVIMNCNFLAPLFSNSKY